VHGRNPGLVSDAIISHTLQPAASSQLMTDGHAEGLTFPGSKGHCSELCNGSILVVKYASHSVEGEIEVGSNSQDRLQILSTTNLKISKESN